MRTHNAGHVRRIRLGVVAGALALGVGACGANVSVFADSDHASVSQAQAEHDIERGTRQLGLAAQSVSCSSGVTASTGGHGQGGPVDHCVATYAGGGTEDFGLHYVGDKLDLTQSTMIAPEIEQYVAQHIRAEGLTSTVTCPTGEPVDPGHAFICTGRTHDSTLVVQITTENRSGVFDGRSVTTVPDPTGAARAATLSAALSAATVESLITKDTARHGLPAEGVVCPPDIARRTGVMGYCLAYYTGGEEARFTVLQHATKPNVLVSLIALTAPVVKAYVTRVFHSKGTTIHDVSCPAVVPAIFRSTFTCTAHEGSQGARITLTVVNLAGDYAVTKTQREG
jgi:Domain of unknown function (DUF4333)